MMLPDRALTRCEAARLGRVHAQLGPRVAEAEAASEPLSRDDAVRLAFSMRAAQGTTAWPAVGPLVRDLAAYVATLSAVPSGVARAKSLLEDYAADAHLHHGIAKARHWLEAHPRGPVSGKDLDAAVALHCEARATALQRGTPLALATGYAGSEDHRVGHATAMTAVRDPDGVVHIRQFNAGNGAPWLRPDGRGAWIAVDTQWRRVQKVPLGREWTLAGRAARPKRVAMLLRQLAQDRTVRARAGTNLSEREAQRLTRAGASLAAPDRIVAATKRQGAGNCTHKSVMNLLKGAMDRPDYLRFKRFMRERRLAERTAELRAANSVEGPVFDGPMRTAQRAHARWLEKHATLFAA